MERRSPASAAPSGTKSSRHSGLCLDINGGQTNPGALIIQYAPHGGINQQFEILPASSVPCAGRDEDEDGVVACYDCDDFDPYVQHCPVEDPPCEFCE
ncbi:MAG: RICIN domain-containing protein [Pyrinomonadaceae bacterium]